MIHTTTQDITPEQREALEGLNLPPATSRLMLTSNGWLLTDDGNGVTHAIDATGYTMRASWRSA